MGLFVPEVSLLAQAVGVGAVAASCLLTSAALFLGIRATMGLRVSAHEELIGLDLGEHGVGAYAITPPSLELALAAKESCARSLPVAIRLIPSL